MSGPEETSESAVDSASPASDGTPSAPAPPSFGQAGPPAMESAPEPEPEQAAPAAASEPEPAAPAFAVPLFGPDKPWWAATPDDDQNEPEAGHASGPEAIEPEPADEAPQRPAADSPAAEPATTEPTATEPAAAEEPVVSPQPGFLVAGVGVPSVDTRGAVPAEPIKEVPLPAYPDTDPDGIPLYPGPQNEPEGSAGSAQSPGPQGPADPAPADKGSADQAPRPEPAGLQTTRPEITAPQPSRPEATDSQAVVPEASGPPAAEPEAPQGEEPANTPRAGDQTPQEASSDDSGMEGALTPDAVLPPGVAPPEYTGPSHDGLPHTTSAASAEQLAEGGVILVVAQTPPEAAQPFTETDAEQRRPTAKAQSMVRRRNQLMIAMVAVVILIPATVLAAFALASGGGGPAEERRAADRPSRTAAPTARRSAPAAPPPASRRPRPANIDSERTDSRPLALVEVFPSEEIELAERVFVQDKTSVNHQCGLAARGAMVEALQRGNCRSVVRATYVNRIRTIAVTTGVAVMPSRQEALAANRAGDPASYEWFRGMPGERSPDIDRAGGHAAGTVRGRYIVYAYATYADGTTPEPGDPILKQVADEFIGYGLRPIDKRATGRP